MHFFGIVRKVLPLVTGALACLLPKFPESYKKVLSEVVINFNLHEQLI